MTKNLKVLAAGLVLACLAGNAQARTGGVPTPTAATVGGDVDDKWCVGKSSGAELCVDGQSNFVPIQNEKINLGSDTVRFLAVYASSFNASGDLRAVGALVVNGNSTIGSASNDTLDLNVTTITINDTINGIKIGTSTSDGTYILTIDGSGRIIGINDQTPDATLEVVPDDGDAYGLRVSSQNGSTDILGVDATNQQVEVTGLLGVNDTTPDATLEVVPAAGDAYALRISSQNSTTNILGVDATNQQAEVTGALGVNDTTPEASLTLSPLNASTTGQIISAATSQTADLFSVRDVNLSSMTRVGPNGHWGLRRYQKAAIDTLVPDFLGALIQCSDCTAPYTVCGSTGAVVAGNWQNIASSASLMGVGQAKAGCGTGE